MNKQPRTAVVGSVKVLNVGIASVLKLGDSEAVQPSAKVLAVQRQVPTFWGHEGDLSQYPIFSQHIPQPNVDERMSISREQQDPYIRVGFVYVSSLSASGILHIGNTCTVQTESRTKHIRHFISNTKNERPGQ